MGWGGGGVCLYVCVFFRNIKRETVSNWLLLGTLGRSWGALCRSRAALWRSWAALGFSWALLHRSWALLVCSGALFGCSWGALGALLGCSWAGSLAPGRPGPREAGNGPAEGSGGFRLRRLKTNGTGATELSRGGGKDFGIQAAPPTLARGYQDLKILDPRH